MKRLFFFTGCLCLSAAMATAQTTTSSPGQDMKTTPQTPTTDPNATGQATREDQRTGTAVSGQSPVGSQKSSGSQKEVKLEGCIQEQGGQYLLVNKKYKDGVAILSSENLAAHVGHEVKVHGNWTTAGSMASSQGMSAEHPAEHGTSGATGSSGSAAGSTGAAGTSDTSMQKPESDQPPSGKKALQASSIEMVSETCKGTKKSESTESPKK